MNDFGGKLLKRGLHGGVASLSAHVEEINGLNVFPVPDGDTGSNMLKTLESGWQAIAVSESDNAGEVMSAFATGAAFGARGNSGVILAQALRGVANGLQGKEKVDAKAFSDACAQGVQAAYAAVVKPVEGTILTVLKRAAEAEPSGDLEKWLKTYLEYANVALQHTPEQLPALREAGVVDSGGAGYLYFAQGLAAGLLGEEVSVADADFEQVSKSFSTAPSPLDFSAFTSDSVLEYGYCTEFFLRLQSAKTNPRSFDDDGLKAFLSKIGDSLVYVRNEDLIKIHVHTKTPGQVLNECQKYGEFLHLKIENMSLQHEGFSVASGADLTVAELPKKHFATVAVAMSDGMKTLFENAGADAVILGGAKDNPSTGDFLAAFRKANAEAIAVLPNNGNIRLAADAAAREYAEENPTVKVFVLPTSSMQQGYSALLVAIDGEDYEGIVADMQAAADGVESLCLTFSVRDTRVDGVSVSKGDFIGFIGKRLLVSDPDRLQCLKSLLLAVKDIGDKEIVTLMYGVDVSEEEKAAARQIVEEVCPCAELAEYDCNQALYAYLIGLE